VAVGGVIVAPSRQASAKSVEQFEPVERLALLADLPPSAFYPDLSITSALDTCRAAGHSDRPGSAGGDESRRVEIKDAHALFRFFGFNRFCRTGLDRERPRQHHYNIISVCFHRKCGSALCLVVEERRGIRRDDL
jgi:hypothetical protein